MLSNQPGQPAGHSSAPGVEALPGRPVVLIPPPLLDIDDACDWLTRHRDDVRAVLDDAGALYLRGMPVRATDDFATVRDVLIEQRAEYREKATPRSAFGDDVFSSTDLPPTHPIRMHNENSYTLTFPGTLLFGCLTVPEEGGATPVADCRAVLAALPSELVHRFRVAGWALHRSYGDRMSLDWRTAFGTDDRGQVERYCAENLISCTWEGDALRTVQRRPAVITHPTTGQDVWFNHAAFWSEWALPAGAREVLLDELGVLPFATTFGDGTPIGRDEFAALEAAYRAATVAHSWAPGDLLLVDNILSAHGREAYRGTRKIVVAMGEPTQLAGCRPVPAPAASLLGEPPAVVSS